MRVCRRKTDMLRSAVLGGLLAAAAAFATGCSGYYSGGISIDGGAVDAPGSGDDAATANDAGTDAPIVTKDAAVDVAPPPPPASIVQLSEIAPNVSGGSDVIELRALGSGPLAGYTVEQDLTNPVVLATLPALTVSAGDVVVIHLIPPSGVFNEISSKSSCSSVACYPNAWDVAGGSTGITFSGRVIVLRRPDKTIVDGVPFYRNGLASGGGFAGELSALQKAGQWLPATCGGNACSTNELAEPLAVDWLGVGSSTTGSTVARKGTLDTHQASDWMIGENTLGAQNK